MQITTIKSTDDKYFAEVWNIYNYSFPAHEKRTLENQKRSLEEFDNCFIDVFLDDKEVVGFMIYWNFDTFTYLEHFAINSSRRNGEAPLRCTRDFPRALGGIARADID